MSFTIYKNIFFDIIQKAYPIIPLKSSLSILLNFRLQFQSNSLVISSTDLDHSIRIKRPIQGEGDFDITVNARKLFEIVKELHDSELTIEYFDNILMIESGGSFSCKIAGTGSRDFPVFPEYESSYKIDISVNKLLNMIAKSTFAVAKDDVRPYLCGVLWEIEADRTGMVATDGHRMGYSYYQYDYDVDEKISVVILPKTLLHLVRVLENKEDSISVTVSPKQDYLLFSNSSFELCSKLIEGPYLDYQKVIPRNNTKEAIVDKGTLLDAVRRVSVLSNQKTHLVKFVFRNNELEIEVLNRDIGGEAHQVIPVIYEGEEHIIGFNAVYFSEILNIIKTPSIRIEMNTQISACLIFPVFEKEEDKKSDDLFLIMPLRI
ncbi:MAG: DNA polymerase III subunit beta [Chitinispirillia bacterium]|jgi:DNA polymerase-3 subunit beta